MKKIIALLLVVVLAASCLAGCAKTPAATTDEPQKAETPAGFCRNTLFMKDGVRAPASISYTPLGGILTVHLHPREYSLFQAQFPEPESGTLQ